MPSEKVTRILLSKTDMAEGDIEGLSEAQAWDVVYNLPKPEQRPTMCFTGFRKTERAAMEAEAVERGFKIVKSVGPRLGYLVCGPNAGPSKVAKAEKCGVPVVSVLPLD